MKLFIQPGKTTLLLPPYMVEGIFPTEVLFTVTKMEFCTTTCGV